VVFVVLQFLGLQVSIYSIYKRLVNIIIQIVYSKGNQ
jgi:hypothetical protein